MAVCLRQRGRIRRGDKSVRAAGSRCGLTIGAVPGPSETGRRFPNAPRRTLTRPHPPPPFRFSSVSPAATSGARAEAPSHSRTGGSESFCADRLAFSYRDRKHFTNPPTLSTQFGLRTVADHKLTNNEELAKPTPPP